MSSSDLSSTLFPITEHLHSEPKRRWGKWRPNILSVCLVTGTEMWADGILHFVATDAEWATMTAGGPRPSLPRPPAIPPFGSNRDVTDAYKFSNDIFKEQQKLYNSFTKAFNDSVGPLILTGYRDPASNVFRLNPRQTSELLYTDYGVLDPLEVKSVLADLSIPLKSVDRLTFLNHFTDFEENIRTLARGNAQISVFAQYEFFVESLSSYPTVMDAVKTFQDGHATIAARTYDDLKAWLTARISNFADAKFINSVSNVVPSRNSNNRKRPRSQVSSSRASEEHIPYALASNSRNNTRPLPKVPRAPENQNYCWFHGYSNIGAKGSHPGAACPDMLKAGLTRFPTRFLNARKHDYERPGELGNSSTY
jgi:hypothetical protein